MRFLPYAPETEEEIKKSFNSLYEIQIVISLKWNMLKESFNSLYEIQMTKPGGLNPRVNSFQFSLWDSWFKTLAILVVYTNLSILFMRFLFFVTFAIFLHLFFQFSLWDSCHLHSASASLSFKLSILFMRFYWMNPFFCSIDWDFQFSLWDSSNMLYISFNFETSFNSLYEIPIFLFGILFQYITTFNSLYEIPALSRV